MPPINLAYTSEVRQPKTYQLQYRLPIAFVQAGAVGRIALLAYIEFAARSLHGNNRQLHPSQLEIRVFSERNGHMAGQTRGESPVPTCSPNRSPLKLFALCAALGLPQGRRHTTSIAGRTGHRLRAGGDRWPDRPAGLHRQPLPAEPGAGLGCCLPLHRPAAAPASCGLWVLLSSLPTARPWAVCSFWGSGPSCSAARVVKALFHG